MNGFSKTVNSVVTYPPDLEFEYDAMGQRVLKIVKTRDAAGVKPQADWKYTYYVRDAAGNVLTTYNRTITVDQTNAAYRIDKYKVEEWTMYGSGRLGIQKPSGEGVVAAELKFEPDQNNTINVISRSATSLPTTSLLRKAGEKVYELANHLGNVLVTVTDGRFVLNSGSNVTGYTAVVRSAMDYSAFGAPLAGRTSNSPGYKYGFNGVEKDAEMHGNDGDSYDFGARMYDARVGRWLSVDPLARNFLMYSPYSFPLNTPVTVKDEDGASPPGTRELTESELSTLLQNGNVIAKFVLLHKLKVESKQTTIVTSGQKISSFLNSNAGNANYSEMLGQSGQLSKISTITISNSKLKVDLRAGIDEITLKGKNGSMTIENNATIDLSGLSVETKNKPGQDAPVYVIRGRVSITGVEGFGGIDISGITFNSSYSEKEWIAGKDWISVKTTIEAETWLKNMKLYLPEQTATAPTKK